MDTLTLTRHAPLVERWRGVIDRYAAVIVPDEWETGAFDTDYALTVVYHESGGSPLAHNQHAYPDDPDRQASGLWQHFPVYWESRIRAAVQALEAAGLHPEWMDSPHLYSDRPTFGERGLLRVGMFSGQASTAAALVAWKWAYRTSLEGWRPWVVTHSTRPGRSLTPQDYGEDVWFRAEAPAGYVRVLRVGEVE